MQTAENAKQIITRFIEDIWNQNQLDKLEQYLHADFIDHSLPPALPSDATGTKQWITATGRSFQHQTIIEDMVAEADKVMIRIRMELKHTGPWRDIEPTGIQVSTSGYRCFRLWENRISAHWALIDGQAIESQLQGTGHRCKV